MVVVPSTRKVRKKRGNYLKETPKLRGCPGESVMPLKKGKYIEGDEENAIQR
jgi:hypothetical protein